MAEDPQHTIEPEPQAVDPSFSEDEAGGPVKTFLEHLEDLRWTLVKCVVAYIVAALVCLYGAPTLIEVLKWPLKQAERRTPPKSEAVVSFGTNVLGRMPATSLGLENPTNGLPVYLRMQPVTIGTNRLMELVEDYSPPAAATNGISVTLSSMGPGSVFSVYMQLVIYGGMTLALPFILFFIGQFVLPAMHVHEKKFLFKVLGFSILLFVLGVAFCYFLLLVICMGTTVNFASWLGLSSDVWRAEEYISFVCWFLLGMGIAFQLPLVLLTLVKVGILNASKLSQFRMYFVVACLIAAAMITPDGNPITMFIMYLPLHFLYEMSVVIAWFWERKERRLNPEV